jgi:hypothetical protein
VSPSIDPASTIGQSRASGASARMATGAINVTHQSKYVQLERQSYHNVTNCRLGEPIHSWFNAEAKLKKGVQIDRCIHHCLYETHTIIQYAFWTTVSQTILHIV